jgi:hypothetical protein
VTAELAKRVDPVDSMCAEMWCGSPIVAGSSPTDSSGAFDPTAGLELPCPLSPGFCTAPPRWLPIRTWLHRRPDSASARSKGVRRRC